MKFKGLLLAIGSAFVSFVILGGAALGYLSANAKLDGSAVDASEQSVPYEQREPNRGVLFSFPDGVECLVYLDFEYGGITAVLGYGYDGEYPVDFTVEADFQLAEGLIDRAGGVEIDQNGERLRYTGVQVMELVSVDTSLELRREIISQVFSGFAQNGISAADFVYIIENSQTTLTVPDCYSWEEEMCSMCGRANVFYLVE